MATLTVDSVKKETSLISENKNELFKAKTKAAFIHFAISILIIGCFITYAILVWFPFNAIELTGIKKIFFLIFSIDLIIGPALTFIVYKPFKKTLKLDLAVIAFLQSLAFIYGAYTVYKAHPIYITFTVDRFSLVTARDADPSTAKLDEYKISTLGKPVFAYASLPTDPEVRQTILNSVLFENGLDIDTMPEFYESFNSKIDTIFSKSLDEELLISQEKNNIIIRDFLKAHNKVMADYAFLPFTGKNKDAIWVWNRHTKQPVTVLSIDPWKLK